MPRVRATRRLHFNAGHRLYRPDWSDARNEEVFGLCANPYGHGHNYELEVTVEGEINPETGYVMDLGELKERVNAAVVNQLDHRNLNLQVPWLEGINPTTENLVVAIWNRIVPLLPAALEETAAASAWDALPDAWLNAARKSSGSAATDAAALAQHGLSCEVAAAFPGICHLLLRYPRDPATALIENASSGGDNAARGMILGLIYGAKFPVSSWPPEWSEALQARQEIEHLIGC
jgi:6-pyruvoyltetrahydropterin/6-carboxytetrahydropterin synthase